MRSARRSESGAAACPPPRIRWTCPRQRSGDLSGERAPIPLGLARSWCGVAEPQASSNVTHDRDAPLWRRFESTLMATSRSIRRAYDLRLKEIGLNLSEACLLAYVVEHGPLTQRQVAERIGMGRAPAGSIVDKLSAESLLVRLPDPNDRRVGVPGSPPPRPRTPPPGTCPPHHPPSHPVRP